MNGLSAIWPLLLLLYLPLLLTACDVDGDLPECKWNVSIDYTYTPYAQRLPPGDYMTSFSYYVFDEQGVLADTGRGGGRNDEGGESTGGGIACNPGQIRFKLPPGKYTVVAWANINGNTATPVVQPGTSTLAELALQRREATAAPDPLYYGAIPIEVTEGVRRFEASLTDAFARLTLHIHWTDGAQPPPEELRNLSIRLTQAPVTLGFTPGRERQAYRNDVACFLPATVPPTGDYRQAVSCTGSSIDASLLLYRLAADDHPVFCLYAGDTPLMKLIDLHRYFEETDTDLAGDCIQEYGLDIEIGDGTVTVTSINMGGWEEGGEIGGWS